MPLWERLQEYVRAKRDPERKALRRIEQLTQAKARRPLTLDEEWDLFWLAGGLATPEEWDAPEDLGAAVLERKRRGPSPEPAVVVEPLPPPPPPPPGPLAVPPVEVSAPMRPAPVRPSSPAPTPTPESTPPPPSLAPAPPGEPPAPPSDGGHPKELLMEPGGEARYGPGVREWVHGGGPRQIQFVQVWGAASGPGGLGAWATRTTNHVTGTRGPKHAPLPASGADLWVLAHTEVIDEYEAAEARAHELTQPGAHGWTKPKSGAYLVSQATRTHYPSREAALEALAEARKARAKGDRRFSAWIAEPVFVPNGTYAVVSGEGEEGVQIGEMTMKNYGYDPPIEFPGSMKPQPVWLDKADIPPVVYTWEEDPRGGPRKIIPTKRRWARRDDDSAVIVEAAQRTAVPKWMREQQQLEQRERAEHPRRHTPPWVAPGTPVYVEPEEPSVDAIVDAIEREDWTHVPLSTLRRYRGSKWGWHFYDWLATRTGLHWLSTNDGLDFAEEFTAKDPTSRAKPRTRPRPAVYEPGEILPPTIEPPLRHPILVEDDEDEEPVSWDWVMERKRNVASLECAHGSRRVATSIDFAAGSSTGRLHVDLVEAGDALYVKEDQHARTIDGDSVYLREGAEGKVESIRVGDTQVIVSVLGERLAPDGTILFEPHTLALGLDEITLLLSSNDPRIIDR